MISRHILLAAGLLAVGACGGATNGGANASGEAVNAVAEGRTLADALDAGGEFARLRAIAENAGLDPVLAGTGPYTIFAPTDAAFQAFGGEQARELTEDAMRPQAMALLRAHIVPGAITRQDLENALSRAGGESVAMITMAGGDLSFARDGDAVIVTAADGSRARLSGEETVVANGALQPVDGLLLASGANND